MSEVEKNSPSDEVIAADSPPKNAHSSVAGDIDTAEKHDISQTDKASSTNLFKNGDDGAKGIDVVAESNSVIKESSEATTNGAVGNHRSESGDTVTQSKAEKGSSESKEAEDKNPEDALCKEVSNLTVENTEKTKEDAEMAQETLSTEKSHCKEQETPADSSDNKENATSENINQSTEDSSAPPTGQASAVAINKTAEEDTLSESDGQTVANKDTRKEPVDSADDEYEEDEDEEEGSEDNDEENEQDLDEDQIKSSPAYIPKHGNFYMHDVRGSTNNADATGPDAEDKQPEERQDDDHEGIATKSTAGGVRSRADRKWEHDLFDDRQQKPKTPKELVRKYGENIRRSEGDETEEVGLEPEQPAKRRSNTSTTSQQSGVNRRQAQDDQSPRKPAVVLVKGQGERERRAPLPRNQPSRDINRDRMGGERGNNRRVQQNRDASPVHHNERREQYHQQRAPVQHDRPEGGGGRRTTFVSSTHRAPQNGGGAQDRPLNNRRPHHNNQEEERGGSYEHGRRGGGYRDDKFSIRSNQQQQPQQRYGRSNTDQRDQRDYHQAAPRYHQEEQEGRNRGGGGRRYTSQRHATAPANGYNNYQNRQQAQPQQQVEDEWSRAGPEDWGEGDNNDGWGASANRSTSNNNTNQTGPTVGKNNFTTINTQPAHSQPVHSRPAAPIGNNYPQSHQHNPHAQRFQPRYTQQQQQPMRTDIPPPNYSQRGEARGPPISYPPAATGPEIVGGVPYPHPRQPTDVVYFDAPQGPLAPIPVAVSAMATGHSHHYQQQPTRERRRLNIAPPNQQQQF